MHHKKSPRAIVIGVDGATWDLLQPWVREGKLSTFEKIMQEGVWGELESTIPPFTLPAWNSAITGVNPGKHGIFDFFRIDLSSSSPTLNINTALNRHFPTVFDILSKWGKRSLAVNIPGTFPPTKDPNIITIGGMLTPSKKANYFYPRDIRSHLKHYPDFNRSYKYFSYLAGKNEEELVDLVIREEEKRFSTAKQILRDRQVDLFWYVFRGTDEAQHYLYDRDGRGLRCIERIYTTIDHQLRDLIDEFENCFLIVMSDHGFSPLKKYIHVNNLLENNNFLFRKRKGRSIVINAVTFRLLRRLPILLRKALFDKLIKTSNALELVNLEKSRAICPTYTSQTILVLDGKKESVDHIRDLLLMMKDSDCGQKVIENVYIRDEVYSYLDKKTSYCFDLLIQPEKGYIVTSNFSLDGKEISRPVSLLSEKKGDHNPDGVFMIWSKFGLRKRGEIGRRSLYDIAPTIYDFLGVSPPTNIDGKTIV